MPKEIFTIFDFETSGLNNPTGSDQIIEVAALRTDLEKDYGAIQMHVRLDQGRSLSDFIKNLTGIKEEDLERGFSEHHAVLMLHEFIGCTTAVAHHYPFDASFIGSVSPSALPEDFICTRVLVKLVEPNANASLKNVAERNGIVIDGHHTAGGDVRATKEILKRYMAKADELGIIYRNVVINDKERPLNYIPDFSNVIER